MNIYIFLKTTHTFGDDGDVMVYVKSIISLLSDGNRVYS